MFHSCHTVFLTPAFQPSPNGNSTIGRWYFLISVSDLASEYVPISVNIALIVGTPTDLTRMASLTLLHNVGKGYRMNQSVNQQVC